MYPFEPLRPAWERLVEAIHERLPWVPVGLDWSEDVHDSWIDPVCVIGHACGWPVATALTTHVRVAGAFALTSATAEGHEYRSVLLSRSEHRVDELASTLPVVAANSVESLSGWVSFLVAAGVAAWPGEVIWTGAHRESLRAVSEGRAEVACIDGHTLSLLRRIEPGVDAGLVEIAHGPKIPSPAVVVRRTVDDGTLDEVRAALTAVSADPRLADDRALLMIDRFVPLDEAPYRELVGRWPELAATTAS